MKQAKDKDRSFIVDLPRIKPRFGVIPGRVERDRKKEYRRQDKHRKSGVDE